MAKDENKAYRSKTKVHVQKKLLLAPHESTDVLSWWNFAWIWQTT